jgi:hypothetical protein
VFVLLLAAMAFILRAVPGRYPMLMMMVLSSPSPAATSGGATPRPSTGSTPSAWPAACCCWPPRPMPGWCCCSATGRPHGPCTALRHNCRRIRPVAQRGSDDPHLQRGSRHREGDCLRRHGARLARRQADHLAA